MPALIRKFAQTHSILGVCLGHQALGEAFGGTLVNLKEVYHGVSTTINIDTTATLFESIPEQIKVGRYHSWALRSHDFPPSLKTIAKDPDGQIMALRHVSLDVCGVQFHPESVMTEFGNRRLNNW